MSYERCFDALAGSRVTTPTGGCGWRARLQGSPREGPESGRKPSFHCEPEVGFTALTGRSFNSTALGLGAPERRSASRKKLICSICRPPVSLSRFQDEVCNFVWKRKHRNVAGWDLN